MNRMRSDGRTLVDVLIPNRSELATLAGTSASVDEAEWRAFFANNPIKAAAQLPVPQLNL